MERPRTAGFERSSRNDTFGDAYSRAMRCTDVHTERSERRGETKRSTDGTQLLVLRAPRMPRGPARGFRYLGLGVGRM